MGQLAQRLDGIQTTKPACPVARILTQLDPEDVTALTSALNSAASTRSIHQALRESGYGIDRTYLSLHRENRCRCSKENNS